MMKLYTYFRSSASYRVRIALHLKAIPFDSIAINLKEGEQRGDFLTKNPQGFVPALDHDGVILTQSMAILDYLDHFKPTPALLPASPIDRAHITAMAHLIALDIHPINNLRILKYLKGPLGQDNESVNQWYRHWIQEGFGALETQVSKYGGDRACFGDEPTMVDLCLVPQMWNARRFETDLSAFPKLVKIDSHLQSLPAFQKAAPENQADADS